MLLYRSSGKAPHEARDGVVRSSDTRKYGMTGTRGTGEGSRTSSVPKSREGVKWNQHAVGGPGPSSWQEPAHFGWSDFLQIVRADETPAVPQSKAMRYNGR
jgi:hypothetical protein